MSRFRRRFRAGPVENLELGNFRILAGSIPSCEKLIFKNVWMQGFFSLKIKKRFFTVKFAISIA